MSKPLKNLLLITDGEVLENSLHLSESDRAERILHLIKKNEIGDGSLSTSLGDLMREVEVDASQADYPEGVSPPSSFSPEDYLDALCDFLSARDIDLHLADLAVPELGTTVQRCPK